jgi:hypothetical protein
VVRELDLAWIGAGRCLSENFTGHKSLNLIFLKNVFVVDVAPLKILSVYAVFLIWRMFKYRFVKKYFAQVPRAEVGSDSTVGVLPTAAEIFARR